MKPGEEGPRPRVGGSVPPFAVLIDLKAVGSWSWPCGGVRSDGRRRVCLFPLQSVFIRAVDFGSLAV